VQLISEKVLSKNYFTDMHTILNAYVANGYGKMVRRLKCAGGTAHARVEMQVHTTVA
jgi:hypothetical protein